MEFVGSLVLLESHRGDDDEAATRAPPSSTGREWKPMATVDEIEPPSRVENAADPLTDGPVTVVVRHLVKPGVEPAFEEWLRGLTRAALPFAGHLGFHIVRPNDPKHPEYHVFFRFDTFDNLRRWEESAVRREWIDRLSPLALRTTPWERHTGLEVWFTPPPGRAAPSRHKMAVVTLLTIYPLILLVQSTLGPRLAEWPLPARGLASAAILVGLMTYAAMPFSTTVFARWLYGPPRT
ncbi:MAG: antibiotic biosynthesis monooxygenase [Planctomycetia bacterium]